MAEEITPNPDEELGFVPSTDDMIAVKEGIVEDDEALLQRAIERWVEFYNRVWKNENVILEKSNRRYNYWGNILRVLILVVSVSLTTISGLGTDANIITVVAGTLTLLTSIEAFFLFLDRKAEVLQLQRELESLRDELGYGWMINVELETDKGKRLEAAKSLLQRGPMLYNEILNKHAFKSQEEA